MTGEARYLFLPQTDSRIHWRDVGTGPDPVIFLPGMSFPASENFSEVIAAGAMAGRRAVMIDFPGSGDSDPAPKPCRTVFDHADCIAAVMDHIGIAKAPLVGYSMGGSVAIALAQRRPDLVRSLIVAEANLTPGGGRASGRIAAVSKDEFVGTMLPRMLERLRAGDSIDAFIAAAWSRADPRCLHANARALVDLPAEFATQFLSLAMPRVFVVGGESISRGVLADAPDPAMLQASGVTVEIMPGRGHELMLAAPEGFADILSRHLPKN